MTKPILYQQYENAKKKSIMFMKSGEINAYFKTLLELNKYKKIMLAIKAN